MRFISVPFSQSTLRDGDWPMVEDRDVKARAPSLCEPISLEPGAPYDRAVQSSSSNFAIA